MNTLPFSRPVGCGIAFEDRLVRARRCAAPGPALVGHVDVAVDGVRDGEILLREIGMRIHQLHRAGQRRRLLAFAFGRLGQRLAFVGLRDGEFGEHEVAVGRQAGAVARAARSSGRASILKPVMPVELRSSRAACRWPRARSRLSEVTKIEPSGCFSHLCDALHVRRSPGRAAPIRWTGRRTASHCGICGSGRVGLRSSTPSSAFCDARFAVGLGFRR